MILRIVAFSLILTLFFAAELVTADDADKFTRVPESLSGVSWNRIPSEVIASPKNGEPLIWAGVIEDTQIYQRGEKVEIEWLCKHFRFANPGEETIATRPIPVISDTGGYFVVSLISDMPVERAAKFAKNHKERTHYMLVGGTMDSVVERNGKKAVFLYSHRMDVSGSLLTFIDDKKVTRGNNSGLIYGKDHTFWLTAPQGWVLDNKSGLPNRLHAVFYPEGSSWAKATSMMYANTSSKAVAGNETLEKVMEYDVSKFKQDSPNVVVQDAQGLSTMLGKKAAVRYFSGDAFNNHEAVAYIDEDKIVVFIVLSSRSKEDFDKSLPAFKDLVGSYEFWTEDVRIENHTKKGD